MPETKNIVFTHKEVVEALIRYNDIHEGLWGLYIEFGLAGANVGPAPGGDVNPAAVIPILKIGLQRSETPSNLTADAALVNPPTKIESKE
jgi:hypothetical protein